MKFMLLTYLDEQAWARLGEAEQQRMMAECGPHVQQLLGSGKFLAGAPLHPTSTAVTVRVRGSKRLVTDGPFAETREQLGGYTIVEARDIDEAIDIAAGFLRTGGPSIIEVRPVVELAGLPAAPSPNGNAKKRFMMLYKPAQGLETGVPPSQEHLAEMGQFIEESFRTGTLLSTEGLQPSSKGARVRLSAGEVTVTDGPFAEAQELVGGFAIVRAKSKEDAIEMAKRFLHVAGDGETEIRQLREPSDFAP